jgi:hypothetical protein
MYISCERPGQKYNGYQDVVSIAAPQLIDDHFVISSQGIWCLWA